METVELPEWRGKYYTLANPEDIFKKLHDGEPWFFLRAQDVTAPGGVEAYANTLNAQAATLMFVAETLALDGADASREIDRLQERAEQLHAQALDCFQAAEAMRQWQNRNPELVKIPD